MAADVLTTKPSVASGSIGPTRASVSSSRISARRSRRREFKVFSGALAAGGVVKGINAGARELPRSELDALTELAKQHGAKGLVWAFVQDDGTLRSPIAKFLSEDEVAAITATLEARAGDLLLIVADAADDRRAGAQRPADGARAALRSDPGRTS